jgi:hypothetical protein
MKFKVGDVMVRINAAYDRRVITEVNQHTYSYSFLWGGHVDSAWDRATIERLFKIDEGFVIDKVLNKYLNG